MRRGTADLDKKLGASLETLVEDTKSELCRDYQRGNCTRGPNCPFRHVTPRQPAQHQGYPHYSEGATEICRDLTIRGACPRGRACPYIHPVRPLTQIVQTQEICRDYMRGECTREGCPFFHSDSVVQVCRDFIRGICERGSACPFHHIRNYRGVEAEPCRDFQRGLCERGNSCIRAHVPEYVEICRNFMRGSCKLGGKCPLHHPSDSQPMDISDNVRPSKRKRETDSGTRKQRETSSKDDLDNELDTTLRNRELFDENKALREENSSLRTDNASLRVENAQLREKLERAPR